MDIKPVITTVTTPQDKLQKTSADAGQAESAAVNGDGYAPGVMNNAADPMKAFWGAAKEAGDAMQIHSQFPCTAVVTEGSAGWKAPLMGQGGTNCFVKSCSREDGNVLVIPLQNHGGGSFGTPIVANREKGVIERPDVKPSGSSQALRAIQSPDGDRTYLTNSQSPLIRIYDGHFKPVAQIDITSLNPDYQRLLEFRSCKGADYAHILSTSVSDRHYLVAFDPSTNAPKWTKQFENGFIRGIFESPDGTTYVAVDEKIPDSEVNHSKSSGTGRDENHFLYILKDGEDKGKMEFKNTPVDLSFQKDGKMIVSLGTDGVKSIDPSRMNPGRYSEKWSIKEGRYKDFQPSGDGRSLYGVDHCDGFYRSHKFAKINTETGKVEWERKAFGEHFDDYRVINDEIHLLTSSEDRKTVHMRKLDAAGKTVWQDSVPLGEIDEYTEGMQSCITPEGSFVFGGRQDGNLYYLHPRNDGETEDTIRQGLSKAGEEEIMQGFRDAVADKGDDSAAEREAAGIEEEEEFVLIDGMKLDKKQS